MLLPLQNSDPAFNFCAFSLKHPPGTAYWDISGGEISLLFISHCIPVVIFLAKICPVVQFIEKLKVVQVISPLSLELHTGIFQEMKSLSYLYHTALQWWLFWKKRCPVVQLTAKLKFLCFLCKASPWNCTLGFFRR